MAYLAQVRLNAKTRVDERALDVLELLMRRRAAEVQNQPGPHSEKVLEAMKRAFKGEWQTGERRLMAELLCGLGTMTSELLKQEQLSELKALAECQTEPAQDRLHILLQYAIIVYGYGQKEQAVELLESSLAEYREKSGGVLPNSANNALDQLSVYLESLGQFVRAESYLQKELELIKVKFGEFKEAKKEIAAQIAQATESEVVGLIGNIAIFYRQHPQSEKRKIKIP
jgi:tetratricopeptide (TPR) repeat protein